MPMTRPRGFTLVELMIVGTIAVILMMLAAPSLREFIDRYRLKGLADNLVGELGFAKSEAVRRDVPVHMTFATGAASCYGIGETAGCSCAACNLKAVDATRFAQTYAGMTITSASAVEFTPRLGVPVAAGTVTVTSTSTGRSIRISLSALGFVSVCAVGGGLRGVDPCPT